METYVKSRSALVDVRRERQDWGASRMYRILVAEDSQVIRRLISICLRGMEVDVVEVENGNAAVDAATDAPPDAMILDVGLPGIDGWEVLRMLRASPDTASVPILMLTGHAGDSARRKAQATGASAFMTKPFQPKELRAQLETLLEPSNVVPLRDAL
jgi:CheY-like chemotaxis protein